jgi:hypothetical protein
MPRPDNKHYAPFSLKRTLKQFADFPIKTKEGEPRFLLVAVDAQTGDAVTFDSYSKEAKYHNDTNTTYNQNGIEIEHALQLELSQTFLTIQSLKSTLLEWV